MELTRDQVVKISKEVATAPSKQAASQVLVRNSLTAGTPYWTRFVDAIRDLLNRPGEFLDLTRDQLVQFLDYLPRQIAQTIDELPQKLTAYEMKRVLAPEPVKETAVTTTANTAPYPVPIGQKLLRRKIGEALECNNGLKPKWLGESREKRFLKVEDLI